MSLRVVGDGPTFDTPDDAKAVLDTLTKLVGDGAVERCIVFYQQPDQSVRWLNTEFECFADQLGFVEIVKLFMYRVYSEGGE